MTDRAAEWAAAQAGLAVMVSRVTALLRSIAASTIPVVGQWDMAEVAMHLSQAWLAVPGLARGDLSGVYEVLPALAGTAGDSLIADLWELGDVTRMGVDADPERRLAVLADRIEVRARQFFAESEGKSAEEHRPWLVEGAVVPRSVLTCHLLNETIMHGYDIATVAGVDWPIERWYASMVIGGFIIEVMKALDPRALVDQDNAAGVKATYDVHLRGDGRYGFAFDDGELRVCSPPPRRVDCHLSVDPAVMLLVAWGRKSQWQAIARGQLLAWGVRPWLGPRFRSLIRNP